MISGAIPRLFLDANPTILPATRIPMCTTECELNDGFSVRPELSICPDAPWAGACMYSFARTPPIRIFSGTSGPSLLCYGCIHSVTRVIANQCAHWCGNPPGISASHRIRHLLLKAGCVPWDSDIVINFQSAPNRHEFRRTPRKGPCSSRRSGRASNPRLTPTFYKCLNDLKKNNKHFRPLPSLHSSIVTLGAGAAMPLVVPPGVEPGYHGL